MLWQYTQQKSILEKVSWSLMHLQGVCFTKEPDMCDFVQTVIPRIKAEWEDVAYALQFKIPSVDATNDKGHDGPKKCCRELLKIWTSF